MKPIVHLANGEGANIRLEVYILQWVIRARKSVASSRGDLLSLITAEAAASLVHHRSLWKAKHQCAQKNLKDVFFLPISIWVKHLAKRLIFLELLSLCYAGGTHKDGHSGPGEVHVAQYLAPVQKGDHIMKRKWRTSICQHSSILEAIVVVKESSAS